MAIQQIYSEVTDRYSLASRGVPEHYGRSVAKAFGYSEEELASIPKEANLGLSCGNPIAIASIKEGETVVDLGSGAGFDAFLAASRVGPTGKVIGVDMNKDMLTRANKIKTDNGSANVEFVESNITEIALESNMADCIISNCVINLVPEKEKQLVFNEMFRLLKPGGRAVVSDILAKKDLPKQLQDSVALYVGCIAGASRVSQYETYLHEAGFKATLFSDTNSDLNAYSETENAKPSNEKCPASQAGDREAKVTSVSCCAPLKSDAAQPSIKEWLKEHGEMDMNEWVASYKIYAVK